MHVAPRRRRAMMAGAGAGLGCLASQAVTSAGTVLGILLAERRADHGLLHPAPFETARQVHDHRPTNSSRPASAPGRDAPATSVSLRSQLFDIRGAVASACGSALVHA